MAVFIFLPSLKVIKRKPQKRFLVWHPKCRRITLVLISQSNRKEAELPGFRQLGREPQEASVCLTSQLCNSSTCLELLPCYWATLCGKCFPDCISGLRFWDFPEGTWGYTRSNSKQYKSPFTSLITARAQNILSHAKPKAPTQQCCRQSLGPSWLKQPTACLSGDVSVTAGWVTVLLSSNTMNSPFFPNSNFNLNIKILGFDLNITVFPTKPACL